MLIDIVKSQHPTNFSPLNNLWFGFQTPSGLFIPENEANMNSKHFPTKLTALASSLALLALPQISFAACVASADNLVTTCSDNISPASPTDNTKAVSVFDAAANPNPPWSATNFNPDPPTVSVNLDSTAHFQFINPTTTNLFDRGIIGANFPNSENPAVNNWVLNNQGTVNLSTNAISARLQAIISDSQVNQVTVNNEGTINASQTFFSNFDPNRLNNLTSASGTNTARYNTTTLNPISAIYTDDNTNILVVNNSATITTSGNFTASVYGRAGDQTINNTGFIGNTSWNSGDAFYTGHWAIGNYGGAEFETVEGSNPDTPIYTVTQINGTNYVNVAESGQTEIDNSGTIQGDVLILDASPLTIAAALAHGATLPVANSGTNSGVRDSNINNSGTINGNIYLGSGEHNFVNSGTLNGNINVDQGASIGSFAVGKPGTEPDTWLSLGPGTISTNTGEACAATGSNTTDASCAQSSNVLANFVGNRVFNLTNTGTIAGDVNISNTAAESSINISSGVAEVATDNGGADTGESSATPGITIATGINGNGLGSSLNAPVQSSAILGTLSISGAAASDNIHLQPVIASNVLVLNNSYFEVANQIGGNVLLNADWSALASENDTALLKWNATLNDNGNLVLGATVRNAYTLPSISNQAAITLNNLMGYAGNNSQLGSLGHQLQAMTNDAEVTSTAERLRPEANDATPQTILNVTNNLMRIVDNHMTEGHMAGFMGADYSPVNHKSQAHKTLGINPGLWLQGVTLYQDQSSKNRVNGYDGNSNGFAIGLDTRLGADDEWLVGGVFSTSRANINANGSNSGNFTNLNSYQGFLYASWTPGIAYVNAMAGVGGNDISGSRFVLGQALESNRTAMQYSVRLDTGLPFQTDYGTLIPVGFFAYSHIDQGSYAENGGSAALRINTSALDSARLGLGGKAVIPMYEGIMPGFGGKFKGALEFSALWAHEFGDINTQTYAAFAVAGDALPFSISSIGPGRDSGLFGVGARLNMGETRDIKPSILLNYFAEVKDQFSSNTGMIQGRIDF